MSALDDLLARGRRRERFAFTVGGSRVEVEFQAISPADYEALRVEHTGADGEPVVGDLLPALASACAVEDDDAARWRAVAADVLSPGEANSLYQFLILLNWGMPGAVEGKG